MWKQSPRFLPGVCQFEARASFVRRFVARRFTSCPGCGLASFLVSSNFNYCPVVWYFCSANYMHKIEKIQKSALDSF